MKFLGSLRDFDEKSSMRLTKLARSEQGYVFWKTITRTGSQKLFGLFLLYFWLILNTQLKQLLVFVILVVSATLLLMFLKPIIRRPRPKPLEPEEQEHYWDQFSMPSGHAARIGVIIITGINLSTNASAIILLIIWCLLILISRVIIGDHFLADIIVGLSIGLLFGELLFNPVDKMMTNLMS